MSQPAETIATLRQQLLQLRQLHEDGALQADQYDAARLPLEQRLVQLVVGDSQADATAAPAATSQSPSPSAASAKLLAGIAVVVIAIAAAGYWWKGSPAQPSVEGVSADGGGNAPHPSDANQMTAMVEKLAQRLQERPDDVQGWAMLGRSYIALGRKDDALKTYAEALKRHPKDADLMADYADSLAALNDHQLGEESMKWVERSLKQDPHNVKGLALAGTYAFERGDFKSAVKYWQDLADTGPADNQIVRQMAPALAEAREKAGLPPVVNASVPAKTQGAASAGTGRVRGTVTLAANLRAKASPDDTVFVYARDASGASRMPLAILRKQVRDLPLQFTLDDSMAMSPSSLLSAAGRVIVEARVSRSGNAMPQPGDLKGSSAPVPPGGSPVQITIDEAVGP